MRDGKRVQDNTKHEATSIYTADNGKDHAESEGFKGNDLFIASYEAQVLLYNVKGETLDWKDRHGARSSPRTGTAMASV